MLIRAEVVSLDNTVANNISSHLLSGNSLKMYFPMYHTITQTFNVGAGEINMNIVKSASGLSGAFITLYRAPRTGELRNRYLPDNYVFKRWNYFYNPMINAEINDVGGAKAMLYKVRVLLTIQGNCRGSAKYNQSSIQSLRHNHYLKHSTFYAKRDTI